MSEELGALGGDYSLILRFDDQSPSFTYGFQAGMIWALMTTGLEFELLFSGENLELVQRMPTRTSYRFEITAVDDTWYKVHAFPPLQPA